MGLLQFRRMRKALELAFSFYAISSGSSETSQNCANDDEVPGSQSLLQFAAGRQSLCPSEVNTLPAGDTSFESELVSFARVVMADYPSSGSTWLKELLAVTATAEKAGNPSCAIYPEGACQLSKAYCQCDGFSPSQDAALIKSHYPAQELYNGVSLDSEQYKATMGYDRLVHLVRHPVALIRSNVNRWGGSLSTMSQNLHCWGEWWERAKEKAGGPNVLVLRYEDICTNTTAKVHEVLQFLGGRFASISLASVRATLAQRVDLDCLHKNDLYSQTQVTLETKSIIEDNKDLMARWGYRTDGSSEWKVPSVVSDLMQAGLPSRGGRQSRNPWSTIWQVALVE